MDSRSRKQRILIVDDTTENIKILVDALQGNYELNIARSGTTALRIANSEKQPDLILLDILMPELDGYEVCKRLKAHKRTRNIPILFVTSLSEAEDEARGLEMGAIDYIAKPIRPLIVRARVRNHLNMKRQRELLEELCSIDALTCIPNRRRFHETLEREWARSIRSNLPISLVMMDIDFFKAYNDNYGHVAGDECLTLVAQTLDCAMGRGGDLVARYGGEEFAVLLSETDLDGAAEVAGKLIGEIEALDIKHEHSEVADRVTVSIGVASVVPSQGSSQKTLTNAADEALYKAKRNGRNQLKKCAV